RRVQTRFASVPRCVRRVLRNRSTNEKFSGEEMDRDHARKDWQCQRSRSSPENLRQNEVIGEHAARVLYRPEQSRRSRPPNIFYRPDCVSRNRILGSAPAWRLAIAPSFAHVSYFFPATFLIQLWLTITRQQL